ncbi:MAG TPA: (2Fe-2S) ferredoxin domain-containing protein [Bacillota bacterium]|nr:(2Fe-2S) ferredoxin domain-containing protein [Bacillota bacterium]
MKKPKHHIFLCTSSRANGEPKGVCNRKDATSLLQYIQIGIDDRGFDDVIITNTGCMKLCDEGPIMLIYPEGYWYGNIDEDRIDEILDALVEGKAVEDYLIAQ